MCMCQRFSNIICKILIDEAIANVKKFPYLEIADISENGLQVPYFQYEYPAVMEYMYVINWLNFGHVDTLFFS